MFALLLVSTLLTILHVTNAATVTVAADGSGNYKTVQAAVDAASTGTIISIKAGTYKEYIHVPSSKKSLTFQGAGETSTILEFGKYASQKDSSGNEIGTFATASVFVEADDFTATGLTFQNTAGNVGQALAIRLDGDKGIFKNSRFIGWQDTILANKGRHFFSNCYIEGAVDFIFGAATIFCDTCHLHVTGSGYITAASTDQGTKYGFVFSHATIDGSSGVSTFLGRPWRPYADVYYLYSSMTSIIKTAGWDNWSNSSNEKTARYYEYGSTGAGAATSGRVSWAHTLTKEEADAITANAVLGGSDSWNPK
jgi:pectinesterase